MLNWIHQLKNDSLENEFKEILKEVQTSPFKNGGLEFSKGSKNPQQVQSSLLFL